MRAAYFITVFLCAGLMPLDGFAQMTRSETEDVISVADRPSPDFNPLGLPVRSFYVHPSIAVEQQYNDNIFAEPDNEEGDFITNIQPALNVISNWDTHALRAFASADIALHADNTNEDYEDIRLGVAGRYGIGYDTFFDSEIRFDSVHEDRTSPDDAQSDEPTTFDVFLARIGFTRALGRLKLFLNTTLRDIEFENTSAAGVFIDNSFRNRTQREADIRLAYEFIPNYELFIRGAYDIRDYEDSAFADRTSKGFNIEAGTAIHISGKLKGEIHGGHINRDFRDGFEDITTADYGGSLIWNATALTSLTASLDRDVIETAADLDASGYVRTQATIGAQHAFDDNLLGVVELSYADDNFVGIERDDEILGAAIELEYQPFRGALSSLRYDFRERDSDVQSEDFTNHRVTLRFGYSF